MADPPSDNEHRDAVESWLAEADREGTVVRWSVRFGRRRATDDESADPLRADEPTRTWTASTLAVWMVEAVGVTLLLAIVGVLVPFSIAWFFGGRAGHHPGVVRAFLIISCILLALVPAKLIASFRADNWLKKRRDRLVGAIMGMYGLPMFMYATAAPGWMNFEVLTANDWNSYWRWLAFWAYLLFDIIALGAPEAFFGKMATLQPASWVAALNTFIIRSVLTIGVIWSIWSFMAVRVKGGDEFVGTTGDLREYLRVEKGDKSKLRVFARAIEQPATGGPAGDDGDATLACLERSGAAAKHAASQTVVNRVNPFSFAMIAVFGVTGFAAFVYLCYWVIRAIV